MKNKYVVCALVIATGLVSVSTLAQSSSGKTRAQVQAELAMAIKDGSFPMYKGDEPVFIKSTAAPKTRQQVRDELIQAQKDGTFPMYEGEELNHTIEAILAGSGELNLPPTAAGPRTRQSVMDEFLRAQAAGTLPIQLDTGD